jgi:serpin B
MTARVSRFIPILAATSLAACSSVSTEPFTALPRELSVAENQLVAADNRFALKLFSQVSALQPDQNVFISPLSVAFALGMTYNGAAGATRTAMQKTLELDGLTVDQVNQSYRSVMDLLINLDSKVQFQLANSIWYRQGFSVEQSFIDLNKKYFDAQVSALDFGSPAAIATMNQWVNDKTNGKIPGIVDFIDPAEVMFLINAIYFKAAWADKFIPAETHDAPFQLLSGSTKQVPLMHRVGGFSQGGGPGLHAIDLPYSRGAFSMTVLVPNGNESVDALAARLDQGLWNSIATGLHGSDAELYLPRFKLEYSLKLNNALSALGMEIAFDGQQADFTGINKQGGLYISRVLHKSFVDVNEEGTEAAAATSVGVIAISAPAPVRIDRPFIFVVRERFSGTILFMGKIADPTVSKVPW